MIDCKKTIEMSTQATVLYNISNNNLLPTYVLCTVLLCFKILFVALLTVLQRMRKNVFIAPEDLFFGRKEQARVMPVDDSVERRRRAHLNDLENIPIFIVVSFLYIFVGDPSVLPSETVGKILLWLFTGARFLHTFVYAIIVIPQPTRALCYAVGLLVTMYMGVIILIRVFCTNI